MNASDPSCDVATADRQLDELRRAEVLSHTRYPRLGRWYPPTAGAVAAAWVATYTLPTPLQVISIVLIAIMLGGATRAYVNKRGVQPSLRRTPRRLKYEMVGFIVVAWVVIGMLGLIWHVSSWWVTALAAFVCTTSLIAIYEHRYALAARQVERAAGIADLVS